MVRLAPDWTGTDVPAASEPAGCDIWWGSPGESAPEGHREIAVIYFQLQLRYCFHINTSNT